MCKPNDKVEGAPGDNEFEAMMKAAYGGELPAKFKKAEVVSGEADGDEEKGEPKGAAHFEATKKKEKKVKGINDQIGKTQDGKPVFIGAVLLKQVYNTVGYALALLEPKAHLAYKTAKTAAGKDRDGKIAAYVQAFNLLFNVAPESELCKTLVPAFKSAVEDAGIKCGNTVGARFEALMQKYYVSGL